MEQSIIKNNTQWKDFYRTAGTMALLIAIAGLVDAITSNMGVGATDNTSLSVIEWFALFQTNGFAAFSRLGVINIITLSLGIPVYLGLYHAHRRDHPAIAALAAILFFIGVAVYISSNTVFSMFALSRQYAAATQAQKPVLEAAGGALLAQGADLTPGTFVGLILTQLAGILITSRMLKGSVFGSGALYCRWIGGAGLAGFALTSIFFILAAFWPENFAAAMIFAMPGGLLLTAYQIMLARRFFQISK